MNAGQNSKYFRRWAAVCRANAWRWVKGRLVDEAVKTASPLHHGVWTIGAQIAQQHCRAPLADDLRHACHVLALGRDVSHTDFTNGQFDRLLLLWGNEREIDGLLIEPEQIAALIAWDNPDQARCASLIRSIEQLADESYIRNITSDLWGTIYWRELDYSRLLGINRKLKDRMPARRDDPF